MDADMIVEATFWTMRARFCGNCKGTLRENDQKIQEKSEEDH